MSNIEKTKKTEKSEKSTQLKNDQLVNFFFLILK